MTRKIISLLICIVFCLSLCISSAFIIAEAEHECEGEDCCICHEISSCEKLLKTVSSCIAAAIIVVTAAAITFVVRVISAKSDFADTTLVSLKVKLSD